MDPLHVLSFALVAAGCFARGQAVATRAAPYDDDPQFPNIWSAIEDSYHTEILMSLPETVPSPVAMVIDELYDKSSGVGRVAVTDHGVERYNNYFVDGDQMFYVDNYTCNSYSLTYKAPFYGWNYHKLSGENFVFGPSALFRIARDVSPTYVGTSSVRNIPSQVWVASTTDDYNITYSVGDSWWSIPHDTDNLRVPLLIEVRGKVSDPWNSDDEKVMSVFYDYMDFTPYVSPEHWRQLELPAGLDCHDRASLDDSKQKPPALPSGFKTHVEIVLDNKLDQTIYRGWLYFDTEHQLVRFDLKGDDIDELGFDMEFVCAYDSGIVYAINSITGACTMSPIPTWALGNEAGSVVGNILLGDPDNFFHLDDSYIFNGYSETRGVLTERWTSTRSDIPSPQGGTYPKVVMDYQFIRSGVKIVGTDTGVQHPVRLDATVYDPNDEKSVIMREAVNFLGFSALQEDSFLAAEFDVRDCFTRPQQRSWIKITFEGIWEHGLEANVLDFEDHLVEKIIAGTNLSVIRIPEIQMSHDDNFVFATLLLLQPAPFVLQFTQYPDKEPTTEDTQVQHYIDDENLCASYCLKYKEFYCSSFYECEGTNAKCYLSKSVNSTGSVATQEKCTHYVRTLAEEAARPVQPFNEEVEAWIEAQIVMGTLDFWYTYTAEDGQTMNSTYKGIKSERELLADDPVFVDYIREDFVPLMGGARIRDTYVNVSLAKSTYISCLLTCKMYEAFHCSTFSFCYDSGRCDLSETVFVRPMGTTEVVYDSDCVIIGRNLLDEYTRVDGAVLNIDANMQFSNILDPNYCAYDCDVVTDFECRSFDYCRDTGTCYLHDTHALDAGDGALQTNSTYCTHYSRSYLTDFEEHENVQISGTRDVYIKYISLDACAKECVEDVDITCNGFDYCEEDGGAICYLTEEHYSDQGVHVSDSLTCDHYERVFYDGEDLNSVVNHLESKKGYGPGDMAGLAVGMLVLSFGLTFAGFYFYNKPK